MKAMKGLGMGKMLGSIKRRPTNGQEGAEQDPQGETPEAIAARSVRAFCESGGPNNQGDEVTFLPAIVDAAESSPAAAAECARVIRKFLKKEYWTKPSYQYNAIMLMRILADNPGQTFTRNLDQKFVDTSKELLRTGRDLSVRQMLMETLDSFEATKSYDEGLALIIELWKKEKVKAYKSYGNRGPPPPTQPRTLNAPPFDPHSQNYFARSHHGRRLPDPVELTNRLEEARTSAKLLHQVVACTPPDEILSNDLIKEFSDRCTSASRSIQGYMTSENPAPDNETMENLIDTNEQLQQALNQHQRAVLNARKHLGLNERSNDPSPNPPEINGLTRPPPPQLSSSGKDAPPLPTRTNGKGKSTDLLPSAQAGSSRSATGTPRPAEDADDPFRDPVPESSASSVYGKTGGASTGAPALDEPRLGFEPFHPGFNPTPSYINRQDSAFDKVHMHGASSSPEEPSGPGGSKALPQQPKIEEDNLYDDDDNDAYSSSGKSKQPMYRY